MDDRRAGSQGKRMRYLTGHTSDLAEELLTNDPRIGLMVQPGNGYWLRASSYDCHAADNGCFKEQWNEPLWRAWLIEQVPRARCLFAVAPDVVGDARATLDRSRPYLKDIRLLGFPVAFVAQDGAESLRLPWDDFDCLFVGGRKTDDPADEWKTSYQAEVLVKRAKRYHKWVHMGRVNSYKRLKRAHEMGCDSVDGTYVKYRRRQAVREPLTEARGAIELIDWLDRLERETA